MDLFLAWRSTANIEVDRAIHGNEPEMARRASNGIETGNMLVQSWVLQAGGEMVTVAGTEGHAKVPAEALDELPDILERYEQATDSRVSVGVGFEAQEAEIALKVAEVRGGDPAVVLYNEDVAAEAHELDESAEETELGAIAPEDEAALEDGAPEADGGVEPTLQKGEGDAKPGEASKIAAGTKDPQAAMPSAPSPVSAMSPQSPPSAGQPGQPAPVPGQAQDPQQLKQAIATVLQDVKANMPAIQQLQQTNPQAFQAIVGMVEAFIAVAEQAFGQGGGQPVQKSEGTFAERVAEESSEHPSLPKEDVEQIVEDHDRLGKADAPMHPATPMHAGVRHELNLPVGSQKDTSSSGTREAGKIKVRGMDGSTKWRSVRAGRVVDAEGQPVSSRVGAEGK